jgi:hypothetical protein
MGAHCRCVGAHQLRLMDGMFLTLKLIISSWQPSYAQPPEP